MFTPLMPPRGNSAKVAAHTGPGGSIVVNTDTSTIHVQDGTTAGGIALSKVGHAHASNEIATWLGYTPAALGSDGKLIPSQVPAIAITDTFPVDSQAEMLALEAEKGDVAVRSDITKSFILQGTDPSVLGNWRELLVPGNGVQSVNGKAGPAVTLVTTDIAEGTNQYFTQARARAALSLTAGTSGATYNNTTGVLDLSSLTAGGGAADNLVGTGTIQRDAASNGMFAGVDAGGDPTLTWINKDAPTGKHVYQMYSTDDGIWRLALLGDNLSGAGQVMTIARTNNAADLITFNATKIQANALVETNTGFKGDGSQLTGLVASAIATGVVDPARLGTGTADNTVYLRGDGVWATPTAVVNSVSLTGAVPAVSTANSGIFGGVASGGLPVLNWVQAGASAGSRVMYMRQPSGGGLEMGFVTDAGATPTLFLNVTRNTGTNNANQVTWRATSMSVEAALSSNTISVTSSSPTGNGLYLPATNTLGIATNGTASLFVGPVGQIGLGGANYGTVGQVLTSAGPNAVPTWSAAPASTVLTGTGAIARSTTTTGVYAGVDGSNPVIPLVAWTNAAAPSGAKAVQSGVDSDGSWWISLANDAINSQSKFLTVTRSGNTATLVTLTATGYNFAIGTDGLKINGAVGSVGQVLMSNGAGAAPTWGSPNVTALSATGSNPRTVSTKGLYAGVDSGGSPSNVWINTSAAANARASHIYVNNSGTIGWALMSDDFASATDFLTVTRAANVATIGLTGNTTVTGNLTVASGNFSGNGSGLTNLAAANITGVVAPANLGTGTRDGTKFLRDDGVWAAGGSGTVTAVSIATANGVSGTSSGGATPALTITLGAITPSSVNTSGNVTAAQFIGGGASITGLTATNITGVVPPANLGTGTRDGTKFLRDDGAWVAASGGGGGGTSLESVTAFDATSIGKRVIVNGSTTPTLTVNTAVFAKDNWISIYNESDVTMLLAQGSGFTLRKDGSAGSGSVTIMPRGTVFLWFRSASEAVASGSLV